MCILKSILLNKEKCIEHTRMIEESNCKIALRRMNLQLGHMSTKPTVLIGLPWGEVNKLCRHDHIECPDYDL